VRAAAGRALLAGGLLAVAAVRVGSEEWTAPAAEKAKTSPLADTPEGLRKGRALFQRHCTVCHGPKGKGDGPAGADARDLTDPAVQRRLTDGEIFWKISTGRKKEDEMAMPAFARQIEVEGRWRLVRFVRSLEAPAASPAP
jgi:mono/diheme cytochrome c family protein